MVAGEVKMYVWRSDAARNYSAGHVMVIATNMDEARDRARDALMEHSQEHSYGIEWKDPDEDDLRRQREFIAIVTKDLDAEPMICDSCVVPGSD